MSSHHPNLDTDTGTDTNTNTDTNANPNLHLTLTSRWRWHPLEASSCWSVYPMVLRRRCCWPMPKPTTRLPTLPVTITPQWATPHWATGPTLNHHPTTRSPALPLTITPPQGHHPTNHKQMLARTAPLTLSTQTQTQPQKVTFLAGSRCCPDLTSAGSEELADAWKR